MEEQVLRHEEEVAREHDLCQGGGEPPTLKMNGSDYKGDHAHQDKDGDEDATGVYCDGLAVDGGVVESGKRQANKNLNNVRGSRSE